MNDLLTSLMEPKGAKKYLYYAIGYSIVICTLYLWGYWTTFDINILQYADIPTILKLAAFPLLLGFAGLMLGSVFGHLVFNIEPSEEERSAARNSRVGRLLRNNTRKCLGVWCFLTMLYLFLGPPGKWDILPVLFALPVASALSIKGFASALMPDRNLRSAVIFVGVIAIPYAYAIGLRTAGLIENGTQFSYLISPIEGLDVPPSTAAEIRPRFLGQVTGLLFFYNPMQRSVSIVKFDDKKVLTLKRYSKPVESVSDWFLRLSKKI